MKSTIPRNNAPKTHSELAKTLGVSRQLITAAASKPDAPKIDDVDAWREYIAAHGRTGSLPADLRRKIGEARLAILEEQKISAKRENARQAGELVPMLECQRQAAEAMSYTFSELERIAQTTPPALAGLDAISIFKRLKSEIERMRKTLKEKFQAIGK